MSRQKHYFIDEENNRINFLDVRYYLHDNGNWYPSSTTVLNAYPKGAEYYEWLKKYGAVSDEIRDIAAERGSIVHNLTELYDNGETVSVTDEGGRPKYSTLEWAEFERYVEFNEKYKPKVIHNELNLVSENLGYGGTLDRIIELNGKRLLIDIKTSNSLYNHYWLQIASYVKLFQEIYQEPIDGVAILWLNAKTRTEGKKGDIQGIGWKLVFPDQDIEHYWKLFQSTYNLWIEENKNYKPRNLSYSLSHKK